MDSVWSESDIAIFCKINPLFRMKYKTRALKVTKVVLDHAIQVGEVLSQFGYK